MDLTVAKEEWSTECLHGAEETRAVASNDGLACLAKAVPWVLHGNGCRFATLAMALAVMVLLGWSKCYMRQCQRLCSLRRNSSFASLIALGNRFLAFQPYLVCKMLMQQETSC